MVDLTNLQNAEQHYRSIARESDRIANSHSVVKQKLDGISSSIRDINRDMASWATNTQSIDMGPITIALEKMSKMSGVTGFFAKWGLEIENINKQMKEFERGFVQASASFQTSGDRLSQVQKHYSEANKTIAELTGNLHVSQQAFRDMATGLNALGHNYDTFNKALTTTSENTNILTKTIKFAQATGQDYQKVLGDMSSMMLNFGSSSANTAKSLEQVNRGLAIMSNAAGQIGMPISYVQDQIMAASRGFENYAVTLGSSMSGVANSFVKIFSAAENQIGKRGSATKITERMVGGLAGMDLGMLGVIGESSGLGTGLQAIAKMSVLRDMDVSSAMNLTGEFITKEFGSGAQESYHDLIGNAMMSSLGSDDRRRVIANSSGGAKSTGIQLLRAMEETLDPAKFRDLMANVQLDDRAVDASTQGALMYQKMYGGSFRDAQTIQQLKLQDASGNLDKEGRDRLNNLMSSSKDIQAQQLSKLQQINDKLGLMLGGPEGTADLAKSLAGGLGGIVFAAIMKGLGFYKGDIGGPIGKLAGGMFEAGGEMMGNVPGLKNVFDALTGGNFGDFISHMADGIQKAFTAAMDEKGIADKLKAIHDSFRKTWSDAPILPVLDVIGKLIKLGFDSLMDVMSLLVKGGIATAQGIGALLQSPLLKLTGNFAASSAGKAISAVAGEAQDALVSVGAYDRADKIWSNDEIMPGMSSLTDHLQDLSEPARRFFMKKKLTGNYSDDIVEISRMQSRMNPDNPLRAVSPVDLLKYIKDGDKVSLIKNTARHQREHRNNSWGARKKEFNTILADLGEITSSGLGGIGDVTTDMVGGFREYGAEGGFENSVLAAIRGVESGGDYGALNAEDQGAFGAYQFRRMTIADFAHRYPELGKALGLTKEEAANIVKIGNSGGGWKNALLQEKIDSNFQGAKNKDVQDLFARVKAREMFKHGAGMSVGRAGAEYWLADDDEAKKAEYAKKLNREFESVMGSDATADMMNLNLEEMKRLFKDGVINVRVTNPNAEKIICADCGKQEASGASETFQAHGENTKSGSSSIIGSGAPIISGGR